MKSFIIYLPEIAASNDTATNLKEKLESFNMDVELFEVVNGNDALILQAAESRTIHPFGIKGPSVTSNATLEDEQKAIGKIQRPGVVGCFYSHYKLWKKCVELNEPIIIWEDDIVLTREYIEVDWEDVLILALGHPAKSAKYMTYLTDPTGEPIAVEYKQTSMPGCCGYAIKPEAAAKLLNVYSSTFLPADNAINKYHVNIHIHNHIMGIALTKEDGKVSLTHTKFWNQ